MGSDKIQNYPFPTPLELHQWFTQNHDSETELWVQVFKKAAGITSVTWNDCVVEAITWGWIDGLKKSLDKGSYSQRQTHRA